MATTLCSTGGASPNSSPSPYHTPTHSTTTSRINLCHSKPDCDNALEESYPSDLDVEILDILKRVFGKDQIEFVKDMGMHGDHILHFNIKINSEDDFYRKVEENDGEFESFRLELEEAEIKGHLRLVVTMPGLAHETVVHELIYTIKARFERGIEDLHTEEGGITEEQQTQLSILWEGVQICGSATWKALDNKEPDNALCYLPRKYGLPAIVVEVTVSQTWENAIEKSKLYQHRAEGKIHQIWILNPIKGKAAVLGSKLNHQDKAAIEGKVTGKDVKNVENTMLVYELEPTKATAESTDEIRIPFWYLAPGGIMKDLLSKHDIDFDPAVVIKVSELFEIFRRVMALNELDAEPSKRNRADSKGSEASVEANQTMLPRQQYLGPSARKAGFVTKYTKRQETKGV